MVSPAKPRIVVTSVMGGPRSVERATRYCQQASNPRRCPAILAARLAEDYGFFGRRETQYSVVGMPKRALTTHNAPDWTAAVVGTLRPVEGRLPSNMADCRPCRSLKTETSWFMFRTTYKVLPCSSSPSPFSTLTPPVG